MRVVPALAVVAASISISGCSVYSALKSNPGQDGDKIGGGGPSSTADVQKLRDQLAQNARSSTAKALAQQALDGDAKAGVLVIGNVGSLRTLDEKDRITFYQKSYVPTAEKWHPGQKPALSQAEFTSDFVGYTNIVTWSIPSLLSRRSAAAVRKAEASEINFPGPRMAHMFGSTGDLVVASTNSDGAIFIDKVLCKDSADDYKTCAAQYARGIYDRNTGVEVDTSMKPKSDGARIDVATYRALPSF